MADPKRRISSKTEALEACILRVAVQFYALRSWYDEQEQEAKALYEAEKTKTQAGITSIQEMIAQLQAEEQALLNSLQQLQSDYDAGWKWRYQAYQAELKVILSLASEQAVGSAFYPFYCLSSLSLSRLQSAKDGGAEG